MSKFIRVTDKDTGHKRTIREHLLPHGNYTVLKQDAVNAAGEPLPPEFADSSESSTTKATTAATEKEKANG